MMPPMPTLKDDAICLRLVDWSETSQIAVLLTEQHGKVAATAKGAKRQTPSTLAKFSGGLELLNRGEAVFITKRGRELANLIEWDLVEGYWPLRRNLRAYQLAMYAADLVHHLLQDHDAHPRTFHVLAELLGALAEAEATPARREAALLRFQWETILDAGYRPVLDRDVRTGQPLDERTPPAFSAAAGGLVAREPTNEQPDAPWRVSHATIALLRVLAAGEAVDRFAEDTFRRANRLLCAYVRTVLDRHLTTMDALLPPEMI